MPSSGKNQQSIREENRALLLRLICTEPHLSRTELARRTGLSKMTVGNIIGGLMSDGLIREGKAFAGSGAGRRAVGLCPDEERALAVGIYISRDFVTASLLTLSARRMRFSRYPLSSEENAQSLMQKVYLGIGDMCGGVEREHILGVGVACIGPVDISEGVLLCPNDFYGIGQVPLKALIQERTGLPAVVNNDMNAAATAEGLYGRGRALQNFLYLGLTHGVGAGVILGGRVFYGEDGFSGEIGHTVIEVDGLSCTCGRRGCLEAYASIPRLLEYARARLGEGAKSVLSSIPGFGFGDICAHAEGDPLCAEVHERLVRYAGTALTNAVNIFDIREVVLGHEGAAGGALLARRLEKYINDHLFARRCQNHVRVEISAFEDGAPAVGSGVLVLGKLFGQG